MADVIPVEGEDAEMNAAIAEARRTFAQFRQALAADWQRMIPVIDRPLIKARFESASTGPVEHMQIEHMWVEVTNFDDEQTVGDLANEPGDIPELSPGDEVRVSPDQITDWVYWESGNPVGGFTLAVLERREQS